MSAEVDDYQTVQVLTHNTRLGRVVMYKNKSKVYWERQTKTVPAGTTGMGTFSEGNKMPAELPHDSELTGPFPEQEITDHN